MRATIWGGLVLCVVLSAVDSVTAADTEVEPPVPPCITDGGLNIVPARGRVLESLAGLQKLTPLRLGAPGADVGTKQPRVLAPRCEGPR